MCNCVMLYVYNNIELSNKKINVVVYKFLEYKKQIFNMNNLRSINKIKYICSPYNNINIIKYKIITDIRLFLFRRRRRP